MPRPHLSTARLEVDVHLPLDRFDLALRFTTEAAVTAIFGPSGSGKSSLLEVVAGLRHDARGVVRLGEEVWQSHAAGSFLPPERRAVGYVPQDGLLFPHRDVRRNLLAGARRARRAGQSPEKSLARVAALLEIEPLLEHSVNTLSGGERQRVALGRALCSGPRLLLLDEPFAALDLPLRRKLLPFLRRVRSELTIPMLLVTHDPIEVQALADEVLVLRDGALIARGEPHDVLTDPAVFPLAVEQGFENVLRARVRHSEAGTATLDLGADGPGIVVMGEAEPGEKILVGLLASDILVATEAPRDISARNILEATVREVREVEHREVLKVEVNESTPPLAVEVTEASREELDLSPGRGVFLIFKAASCRLYGAG